MRIADSPDEGGLFRYDIIDLSDSDLAAVADLPNSVLRGAIERVRAELASGTETAAFFESSLRSPWQADEMPSQRRVPQKDEFPR